jgi:hypothetical protein
MLGVLQIQMLVYVIVYAYTKKVKYAEWRTSLKYNVLSKT